jgi:uncharacterized membrane protein
MAPQPEPPLLFEAISTPPPGLPPRGLLAVAGGLAGVSALVGVLFAWFGAWPVLGFAGLEVLAVVGLLALHRRGSRREFELVRLADGRLTVLRTDRRGRREELALDPYWARLFLQERPGRVSALVLRQHRRTVEIGAMLGEDQKRDLAAALGDALRRYREPVFDNPQLRDG